MVKSFALMLVQVSISNVWYPLPFEEQTALPIPSSVPKNQQKVLQYVSLAPKLAFPRRILLRSPGRCPTLLATTTILILLSVAGVLAVTVVVQSTRFQMRQEMYISSVSW